MTEKKLLTYAAMSRQLGIGERMLRDWAFKRKVPSYRIGHRTVLFDPARVRAALTKFEVPAATKKILKAKGLLNSDDTQRCEMHGV